MNPLRPVPARRVLVLRRDGSVGRALLLVLAAVGAAAVLAVCSLGAFAFWVTRDVGTAPAAPVVSRRIPVPGIDVGPTRIVPRGGWSSRSGRLGSRSRPGR